MTPHVTLTVTHVPEAGRIEARGPEGKLAGFIDIAEIDGGWDFLHTEVTPDFKGLGVSSRMTARAFELAKDSGLRVRPTCPYTRKYVAKHPEVEPLLLPRDGA